jgi:hypothetical protein
MRRQKSEGLPVSSTFVMVEEFCRFVVGIVLEVFQRIAKTRQVEFVRVALAHI